ncbi:MAG: hypothetical protein ACI857_001523, partial [Arenicella sp.]
YVVNSFDGQVTFNDGKTKDEIAGIQSWKYYEKVDTGKYDFEVKNNKSQVFGIAAFQYFTEIVGRMSNAEIIRYAGEKEFNGTNYDLVYATWKTEAAHKEVDQYILYFNKTTKMLDYASYTLRDNYLKIPGSGMMYGSIAFTDYKKIDGYMVPHTQSVFLMKPEEKLKKYIHRLTIDSFSFDGFDKGELYPDKTIKTIGDSKL